MLTNQKCSKCHLNHSQSQIKYCYQKKFYCESFINHVVLNNNQHLSRSNSDNFLGDVLPLWIDESNYERYYCLNGCWHQWSLQYDLKAIYQKQVYNNCQLDTIPLGYGQIYLRIIQNFFRKKIIQRKNRKIITHLLSKPQFINNLVIPDNLIFSIVTFV